MTTKQFFNHAFIGLLLAAFLTSCNDCMEGNGKMATRTATFSEVTAVKLSLSADVKLVNDSSGKVKIEGESNLIEAIVIEQNGNKLTISSDRCFSSNKPITITIPMKTVSDLQINGSGSITSETQLGASDLELGINGSGDIVIDVRATNVKSKINGSGNIVLKGSAQRHKVDVNGSGNLEAADFPTGNVAILVNGSGDCKVLATTALAIKIRGSGSVYYAGSPDISSDIKGSGSIQKVN